LALNKTNIAKIFKNKPVVYKILDAKGKNIYTGSAKRGRAVERLGEHLPRAKDAIPGAKFFQIKQMRSIDKAKTEEKRVINREKPKYNQKLIIPEGRRGGPKWKTS